MGVAALCRVAGGILVVLIGAAIALGGVQLLRGGPAVWPDVVASATTFWPTSIGMIVTAAIMLIAGGAVLGNIPWGGWAAAIAAVAVVAAAFWVNYLLFGNVRLLHLGTNVAVAAILLALLWFGYSGQTRKVLHDQHVIETVDKPQSSGRRSVWRSHREQQSGGKLT